MLTSMYRALIPMASCLLLTSTAQALEVHALAYHDTEGAIALNAAEATLADEVRRLARTEATLDLWLVRAARNLATHPGAPRDALIAAGVSDAFAIPVRYSVMDSPSLSAPVEKLLASDIRSAGATHYGIGVVGTGAARRVGMIFVRRGAELSRFPMQVEAGDRFLLNGRLGKRLNKPLILVATPNGRVHELQPKYEHGVFWTMVPFADGVGRYYIEVQANGGHGVQVLNLMAVYAAEPGRPVAAPVVRLSPPVRSVESVGLAADRAVKLINRSRSQAGLPALHRSTLLDGEATRHSSDMARGRFFGHVSPNRGGLGTRLSDAGYPGLLATENIAIAPHPDWAHAELLRSPSHFRNIMDPQVTHVGVGVYERSGPQSVYTFTQIFARLGRR